MEIVAFDTDDRADGNGKAGITWISKTLLNHAYKMNNTNTVAGGWTNSALRTYLRSTIKPLIPATVRNAIVEVTKATNIYEGSTKVQSNVIDDVWIPSGTEVTGLTYETTDVKYTSRFNNDTARIKYRLGDSARAWWLRSTVSSTKFGHIDPTGLRGTLSPNSSTDYIALGFCTN